jgi:hypothetical protein
MNAAVHAEYVVMQNGSYVTLLDQLGTISAVTSSSITIQSADGFSQAYTLPSTVVVTNGSVAGGRGQAASGATSGSSTLSVADLTTGGTVRITALKESAGNTAQSIQLVQATN